MIKRVLLWGFIGFAFVATSINSFTVHDRSRPQEATIPPPPTSVFMIPLVQFHEMYPFLWTGTVAGLRWLECGDPDWSPLYQICAYLRMIRREDDGHYTDWYAPVSYNTLIAFDSGRWPLGSWCSIVKRERDCCMNYYAPSTYDLLCQCDDLAKREGSLYVIVACVPERPPGLIKNLEGKGE